jgi:nucleoside-diphosphate-sugar epimerase
MLSGHKILVTGAAGRIGLPLAASLVKKNEVWGLARFSHAGAQDRLSATGVTPIVCDLADGQFDRLPTDFDYVIHLASVVSDMDHDRAMRNNAEAAGLLLQHVRKAKRVLVMSTASVYKPNPDSSHVYTETDALGEGAPVTQPAYSVSKIAEEGVARFCARAFDVPVVIARMNAAYGPNGGVIAQHIEAIVAGESVVARYDPAPYAPIFQDDINLQVEALLDAATVPATIVNWCGDEIVTVQEWCAYIGRLVGKEPQVCVVPQPGTLIGLPTDMSLRKSITGPCTVNWRDGIRRTLEDLHPESIVSRH